VLYLEELVRTIKGFAPTRAAWAELDSVMSEYQYIGAEIVLYVEATPPQDRFFRENWTQLDEIGQRCDATNPYLPDLFVGDFLFRVARSNFAEAGGRIALLITMSFAVIPFP
jgi:hypothetical protein